MKHIIQINNKLVSLLKNTILLLDVLFACILFSQALAYAYPPNDVSVRLFEAHRPVYSLQILPPFELILPNERNLVINTATTIGINNGKICLKKLANQKIVTNQSKIFFAAPQISIRNPNHNILCLCLPNSNIRRQYHGSILLSATKYGALEIINKLPLFTYIEDVVASEAPVHAPLEMLKAQTILVQNIFSNEKGILGDSTQSQCYLGASLENESISLAVKSVFGKKLYYKGSPIIAYYHSTCAGGTSNGAKFFHLSNGSLPHLKEIICTNCHDSPFWKKTISLIPHDSFIKVFGNGLPEVKTKDQANRPLSLKLANGKIISGYDFWIRLGNTFGWDKAPGTRFKILNNANNDYMIESTGAGHGVGLCQWGACGLAKQGKSYEQILRYYFPDCEIH